MILGARAHDFRKLPVDELAKAIAAKGFTSIQLAMSKSFPELGTFSGKLNPGMANYTRDQFKKNGINISVLGCYVNLIHPDKEERKQLLQTFKEHIRFVKDFGCNIVGSETGSMNPDYSFNPENHSEKALQILIESVSELVDEAEKFGVMVCIEGVSRHSVHTPEKMRRVLDTIKSNNLQVIFDAVNFLSQDNYRRQEDVIKECFELFGDRIVAAHAKDFIVENGKLKTVSAGKGMLNYEYLLRTLNEKKPYINLLIEGTKEEVIMESVDYINKIEAGIK